MIYPADFLQKLDNLQHKTIYARVIALTKDEQPLEQIEGRLTGGSISLEGNNSVRRTCQLTIVAPELSLSEYDWTQNTKIKVAIGVKNTITYSFPDIIWFEQGTFVITQFSRSYSTTADTINITGQDKMCLLNGTIGGVLNSSVDFGAIEEPTDIPGKYKKRKLPIKDIIRDMVHQYGGEPYYNIIINDLDEKGLSLQEYRYNTPLYIWRPEGSKDYVNGTLNGEQPVQFNQKSYLLQDLMNAGFIFDSLYESGVHQEADSIQLNKDGRAYNVAKIDFGETAGYTEIELEYPSDLIANPGESIESVLKKIVNFLGNYEYFYNIYGQFVFQKKKVDDNIAYNFENNNFTVSFNSSPEIKDIRNDYTVWGERSNGVPIHLRYAIDKKPEAYASVAVDSNEEALINYNQKYGVNLQGQESIFYVWSESPNLENIIKEVLPANCVQFSFDWFNKLPDNFLEKETMVSSLRPSPKVWSGFFYNDSENFIIVTYNGSIIGEVPSKHSFYIQGVVEWEQIIAKNWATSAPTFTITSQTKLQTVIQVPDWREIIYQMAVDYSKYNHISNFLARVQKANPSRYSTGITGYEQYYIDMLGFWRELYNPNLNVDNEYLKQQQENIYLEYKAGLDTRAKDISLQEIIKEIEQNNTKYIAYTSSGELFNRDQEKPLKGKWIFNKTNALSSTANGSAYQTIKHKFNGQSELRDWIQIIVSNKQVLSIISGNGNAGVTVWSKTYGWLIGEPELELETTDNAQEWFCDFLFTNAQPDSFKKLNYLQYSPIADNFGWSRAYLDSPNNLIFDIDFLDTTGELGQYSIPAIGHRPKVVSDKQVKSLYYLDTPNIIFGPMENTSQNKGGYRYFNAPNVNEMFIQSTQGRSAIEKIQELLYQHGYVPEAININTIPIYYLEPNSRIHIKNQEEGVIGDYIINRIQLPLAYSGTMTINATRVQPSIL